MTPLMNPIFDFHKVISVPNDSAYDSNSDSVANENQPLASFWFLMRGRENREHRAKERTNNKLNSHNGVNTGI